MCDKCNNTGRLSFMVWSGAYMFQPCGCEVSKENEKKSLERLNQMHQEIMNNLESMTV